MHLCQACDLPRSLASLPIIRDNACLLFEFLLSQIDLISMQLLALKRHQPFVGMYIVTNPTTECQLFTRTRVANVFPNRFVSVNCFNISNFMHLSKSPRLLICLSRRDLSLVLERTSVMNETLIVSPYTPFQYPTDF